MAHSRCCQQNRMEMPDRNKLNRLLDSIDLLLNRLSHTNTILATYPCIDLYYYIQKTEELKLIYEAINQQRLDAFYFVERYREVYWRWRKDALWLNKHILFSEPCRDSNLRIHSR